MPNGFVIVLRNIQYRLSRSHSAGVQIQRYNRVIIFNEPYTVSNTYFVEGFDAFEFIMEMYRSSTSFRKSNLGTFQDYDFDRFEMIGRDDYNPEFRSRLSFTPGNTALKVNDEFDIFGTRFRDVDASSGLELDSYNSSMAGSITDINQHDRDVRSIGAQRNILTARHKINPTPPPEAMTEQIMETF